MLIFIVPLKSKKVSKNWTQVCRLLERCIRSIGNQTTDDFKIIIVCHEKPEVSIENSFIYYIEVDFPPPEVSQPEIGQIDVISQFDRDKNKKMWLGLEYASHFSPSHVMFVDADDYVSCRIAEFVNKYPHNNGWFLDSGYVYEDGKDRIYHKKNNFYLMSGTSHIISYSLMQDNVLHSIYTDSGMPLHQLVVGILSDKKAPLESLPFAGAVYVIENGENINADKDSDRSGREDKISSLKSLILSYPRKIRTLIGSQTLSKEIIDEFGLGNTKLNLQSHLPSQKIVCE